MRKILALIVVIVVIILISHCISKRKEGFDLFSNQKKLEQQFLPNSQNVSEYVVDTMVCSPDCCGQQFPSIDGMTLDEYNKCVNDRGIKTDYVRSNYTCANGVNGVGCPCIKSNAMKFLINRGNNSRYNINTIDDSMYIKMKPVKPYNYEKSPLEKLELDKSIFVNEPKQNDLKLQRVNQNLDNLQMDSS